MAVLVRGFLGYHLRCPFVSCRVAVAMKDLRRVVAQKRIHLVFAVTTVGVQKVWQVLREPNYRNAFGSGRGLK